VGTALLPMLSRQVRAGEAAASLDTLNRAIEYALFLTLPAALALIVCAYPIILVLFGHGAFDTESARLSSQALAAYAVGLPAFVLVKVLAPAFFARGDTSLPVKVGMACVGLNLILNVAFMVPLAHIGPALATSVAATCNVIGLTIVLVRRAQLRSDRQLRRRLIGMVGASLVMAGVLVFVRTTLFTVPPHGWLRYASLTALIMAGLLAYAIAAPVLGAYNLRDIKRVMSRRRLQSVDGSATSPVTTTET
jgi:putative peptidoglycan lipid II flippase